MNAQLVPGVVRAATGHMPFRGHRTQREVREDEGRHAVMRSLCRPKRGGNG